MKVLLDADAYIGTYNEDDALHQKATHILSEMSKKGCKHFVTYDVVDEVTTKLSYQLGKGASKKFIKNLLESNTQIIFPTEESFQKTLKKFQTINSKNVSLTECTNMIAYKEYEINAIFSFDKIYSKQGLEILE